MAVTSRVLPSSILEKVPDRVFRLALRLTFIAPPEHEHRPHRIQNIGEVSGEFFVRCFLMCQNNRLVSLQSVLSDHWCTEHTDPQADFTICLQGTCNCEQVQAHGLVDYNTWVR